MKATPTTASRLIALIALFAIGATTDPLVTAPFNGEPCVRQEIADGPVRSVRSLTERPDAEALDIPSTPRRGGARRDDGTGRILWSAADENAISDHVAISADGSWMAVGYTLNDERLEVRNASDGELEFAYPVAGGGSWTAISANGQYIAYSAVDSVWIFERNQGETPLMRFGMEGYAAGPVALSANGSRLIATGIDPEGETNRVWGFDRRAGVGQPIWRVEVDAEESFSWYGANITPDGATAVVNGKFMLFVINAADGDLIWQEPTYNTESPVAISDDGATLATGSLSGRLRVFSRNRDGYSEIWRYNFGGAISTWVSACALSGDGSTLAAGTLDFLQNSYQGRLALFQTYGAGQPVWVSEPAADEIAAISISQDGGIIAAVSWGDIEHRQPDLIVHERHNRQPFYRLTTDGSLSAVSVARDGSKVVAAGKATHNRVFGRGGQVHCAELLLAGAVATGVVRDEGGNPLHGVELSANNSPYRVRTNDQGRFTLRIEAAANRQATVYARKPGFMDGVVNVQAGPDRRIENVNFSLEAADDPPRDVRASQGSRNQITISWRPYNGRRAIPPPSGDVRSVAGTPPTAAGITGFDEPALVVGRDESDEADSIRIYRGYTPGGPYAYIGEVAGDESRFVERVGIFPGRRYYYVVTAFFGEGESAYSEETFGWLDDEFLIYEADLAAINMPRIDGTIQGNEWAGAVTRDISDVLGYDAPDSAGSVTAKIAFNDAEDKLLIAVSYYARRSLQERMGIGVYVDDAGDGRWSVERPGSEGNYWAYWINGAPNLRYRSLTGGAYAADPYYQFENPPLAMSDARGYVEIELALPLGFHSPEEIALFAPEKVIGLAFFAMQRDEGGNPVFNGWWPQDMFNIVTEPQQFGRVHIPATVVVPPGAPGDIFLDRDGSDLIFSWADPDTGVDGAELADFDGIHVYRNGELIATAGPGEREYMDEEVLSGGWYSYSAAAYVIDRGERFEGPRSGEIGLFASHDPEVAILSYDDGGPEGFYVVDFAGEDNRFGTNFALNGANGEVGVFWVDFYTRGGAPIDVYMLADNGGTPSEQVGPRVRTTPPNSAGFHRAYFPGVEQPRFEVHGEQLSAWATLNYLPESPGAPAIGVDASVADPFLNFYYTAEAGWRSFGAAQPMIRIAVGVPPAANRTPEDPPLPKALLLAPNFPNPFNGTTTAPVTLPGSSSLTLTILDFNGRVIWTRETGVFGAGRQLIPLERLDFPSGAYYLRVSSDYGSEGRALHLVR